MTTEPRNSIKQAPRSETNRLIKFKRRYDMYNDNFDDQVISKLGKIYRAFAQLKLDVQLNTNNNLYKQIVNAISNVYSFGVTRTIDNDDLAELYNTLRIDKTMTQANRFVNAFNDVVLQVGWDFNKEQPKLLIRLPHLTEVDFGDGEVQSVMYFVEMIDKKRERWAFWSNEEHYYIERGVGEDKIVPVEDNDEMVNPFGVLPFVFMHNGWRDTQFWDAYTGDDLTNGTIDMAVHLTFLNHIIKTQSFKQLVGKGDNVGELLGQVLDPLSILTLTGQNTEISVLDMQSNYEQLHSVVQELANSLAISYGVSPNQFRMSKQASSGFALKMENIKLDRFTVEQQQDFKDYEKELFELIKVVSEEYGKSYGDASILLDFVEPSYPEPEADLLTYNRERIDLGLTAPYKILMEGNPDLKPDEAKLDVEENLKARNEMIDKVNKENNTISDTMGALGIE